MKNKIFITTLILFLSVVKSNAQINNLSDLLTISDMPIQTLVENLQYKWEILQPSQELLDDNRIAKEYYTFKYIKNNRNQTLKRVITGKISTGFTQNSTELISNETQVFSRIKNTLSNSGFTLQYKGNYFNIYSDGNYLIKIQTVSYKETKLSKGYYSISIIQS